MRIPTFRLSVIAGSLTRITQGAQPFLLPLMLQLGFGMSAGGQRLDHHRRRDRLAGDEVAGAAHRCRRFGFRNSLIVNGLIASAGYAVCGLFRPGWPMPGDLRGAGGLRLLHVVPVHRLQHHRL